MFVRLPSSLLPAISLLLALLIAASPAQAGDFVGSVQLTSDYFWRGYTKSAGDPSWQVNSEYVTDSGAYAGLWVAQVDFNRPGGNGNQTELTPYVGYSFQSDTDWVLDLQLARYVYNPDIFNTDADYNEYYAFLHYRDYWTFELSVADDAYNRDANPVNFQVNGRYPLGPKSNLSAGAGYYRYRAINDYDYLYWNVGYSRSLTRSLALDLRYFGDRRTLEQNFLRHLGVSGQVPRTQRLVLTFSWSY